MGRRNLSGTGYMLVVVLGISLAPLFFDLGRSSEAPFLFSATWRLGVAIGCLFFLFIFYRRLVRDSRVRSFIFQRLFRWGILFAVIGNCEYLLFAWSSKFTDIAVVTIIYEIWPLFLIILTGWLYRDDKRYRKFRLSSLPLLLLPFAGLIMVVLSQTGGFLTNNSFDTSSTVVGVLLALGAALLAPLMAFGFKWGSELSVELGEIVQETSSLDMFCAIVAFFISSLVASILTFSIGAFNGESVSVDMFVIAVIGGIVANAVGGIAWRKAHFVTDNLGIHAVAYAVPIVSILWLSAFSRIGDTLLDFFTIGAIAIVSANVLVNSQAEIRLGFKALILSLGISGAIVYFRESLFEWGGVESWFWAATEYFEAIALSATVFTLLLAFRVARLVTRAGTEEARLFAVYRRLDILVKRGIIDKDIRQHIIDIDRSKNNSQLKEAYSNARQHLVQIPVASLGDSDLQIFQQAESDLDALVRSKQTDIVLGELFALGLFAVIIISLTLFSKPPGVEGWTRFLVDFFAMLLSAVIAFLVANVFDLQHERDEGKLALEGGLGSGTEGSYGVNFLDTEGRWFDQWLSGIMGLAIIVCYFGLLAHKWVGWFPWIK